MIKTQTNNSGIYPLRPCSQWRLQWERQTGPLSLPRLCPGRQSFISFSYEAQVFRVSQYHSVHQVTNKGQFLAVIAPEDRISKANFKKFSGGNTPDPLCGHPIPHLSPVQPSTVCRTQAPQCWDRDQYVPIPMMPTCAPVRTTSWRHHCLEQDYHGPFTSTWLPSPFSTLHYHPSPPCFIPSPSFRGRNPLIPSLSPPSPFQSRGPRVSLPGKTFHTSMAAGEN